MDRVLGLLLLAVYIVAVVGLAAAVTFVVIRIFPTERTPKGGKPPEDRKRDEPSSSNGSDTGGRLYRRAKRGAA